MLGTRGKTNMYIISVDEEKQDLSTLFFLGNKDKMFLKWRE